MTRILRNKATATYRLATTATHGCHQQSESGIYFRSIPGEAWQITFMNQLTISCLIAICLSEPINYHGFTRNNCTFRINHSREQGAEGSIAMQHLPKRTFRHPQQRDEIIAKGYTTAALSAGLITNKSNMDAPKPYQSRIHSKTKKYSSLLGKG